MSRLSEEKSSLLYKILRFSFVYKTMQFLVTKKNTYKFIYETILKTDENSIVLDCGCGPAQYRNLIKCSKYVGIDFNEKYIARAIKKYPKDNFYLSDISTFGFEKSEKFSHIFLIGLLHHLNDDNASKLIKNLAKQLDNNGKIVSIDPLYDYEKKDIYSRMANYFASKDRGNFVRTEKEYKKLINAKFLKIESSVYEKLLRMPWFHYVMYIYNKKN